MTDTPQHRSRFIVGIDLGTTNSAVAYIDTRHGPGVRHLPIPQLVAPGEVAAQDLLPSFCYVPAAGELPEGALRLPWTDARAYAVGVLARDHGAAVPGRLIASAKSWLAHGGVDRTSRILPWGGDLGADALSPVAVSARYLEHLRAAWDAALGAETDDDGTPCGLAEQQVVLTVPASFDEVARELTLRAASEAGLRRVTLLEEPLAAFYDWLCRHEADWQARIREGQTVVVIDVGGGTTDFSLIRVDPGHVLRRTAVGEHLLLGGDNMDMALAREAETAWQTRLSARHWSVLCQRCRLAKERLLSADGPDTCTVGLGGAGSSVVAGSRSHSVSHQHLLGTLMDGFFPELGLASPGPLRRAGMREMGLPFAADPAITRHLLGFLREAAGAEAGAAAAGPVRPDLVLFNGGALTPEVFRRRLAGVLGHWGERGGELPTLEAGDLSLAVARGAAYYGRVRRGEGVRVRGGIARAYYLEVETGAGAGLLCVMPRDTEEGLEVRVPEHEFRLSANRVARFPLHASSTRLGDSAGAAVDDRTHITTLAPVQALLAHGRRGREHELVVRLGAVLTEVGTLQVWCETTDGRHRFPLSFDLRTRGATDGTAAGVGGGVEITVAAERLDRARAVLGEAFARRAPAPPAMRAIEEALELERREWGLSLLRHLADALAGLEDERTHTAEHEARWLNLAGFCLRPGFGTPGDDWRLAQLWKLWHAGPAWKRPQVMAEWWTCWRRVAGGLRSGQQQQVAQTLSPVLLPRAASAPLGPAKANPQEAAEMWRCLGALERLPPSLKHSVLTALLRAPGRREEYHWWAAARLGARRLLHGPANAVLPAAQVEPLLQGLLHADPGHPESRMRLFAVASLSRLCGVRDLDLAPALRTAARERLVHGQAPAEWVRKLDEATDDSVAFQAEVAGDSLPLGLVLVTPPR